MGLFGAVAFLIAEIALSLAVAEKLGILWTVIWILGAIVIGINLIRIQGPLRMAQAAQEMREGKAPQLTLAAGLFAGIAAVLLIIPGFLSDVIALILLIPLVQKALVKRFKGKFALAGVATHSHFHQSFSHDVQGNVYEGEIIDPDAPKIARQSHSGSSNKEG